MTALPASNDAGSALPQGREARGSWGRTKAGRGESGELLLSGRGGRGAEREDAHGNVAEAGGERGRKVGSGGGGGGNGRGEGGAAGR